MRLCEGYLGEMEMSRGMQGICSRGGGLSLVWGIVSSDTSDVRRWDHMTVSSGRESLLRYRGAPAALSPCFSSFTGMLASKSRSPACQSIPQAPRNCDRCPEKRDSRRPANRPRRSAALRIRHLQNSMGSDSEYCGVRRVRRSVCGPIGGWASVTISIQYSAVGLLIYE